MDVLVPIRQKDGTVLFMVWFREPDGPAGSPKYESWDADLQQWIGQLLKMCVGEPT